MKRFILIDAHAIIHRAYHALPPLTTPKGEMVNAVYGFTTMLLRILREEAPDYVAAAFDMPGPTFRHVAYERYKAQRPETPGDLASQFARVKAVLGAFGIPVIEKQGYEADDIIGAITKKLEKQKNIEIVIVTGDMDALQLVRPRVKVCAMQRGISETVLYDERAVRARYGFKPAQLIDFKGLKGDPSDNIPGVKGIGEKTATELIKRFGSVEGVYRALAAGTKHISSVVAEKLRKGEEDAALSKKLATIVLTVPMKFALKDALWKGMRDTAGAEKLFYELGFASVLKKMRGGIPGRQEKESKPRRGIQQQLLDVPSRVAPDVLREIGEFERLIKEGGGQKRWGLILLEGALFLITSLPRIVSVAPSLLKEESVRLFFETGNFVVHDGKSLLKFLRAAGVESLRMRMNFDIMLAAYVVHAYGRDFSYAAIATRELGRLVSPDMSDELLHFFEIADALEKKLSEGKLRFVFKEIEMPLIPILADMEERGVGVDREVLAALGKRVNKKIALLAKKIWTSGGERFNINSPPQLSKILFEKLGLRVHGLRKTEKGGVISTRESELEKLRDEHPIVKYILEYRELAKLKTTYIEALPALIQEKSGRVHTTFNQTGTATGRLSSSNPNLQNIPAMSLLGREIRKAFIARAGFTFISCDYSQIELRVAAHLAHDEKMIDAFRKGIDIHRATAAEVYNVPSEKVTPELRRAAKTLNFGVLYGMGPQAFAEATGMSRADAQKFIEEYFHDFSGVREYIERIKEFVKEHGYAETLFGRRRSIPEINSPNWQIRREAERMAINHPIQGTATGDIIKLAMIKIDEWIRREKREEDAQLLLQVHDELLFEVKENAASEIGEKIKTLMENVVVLDVPLAVDTKIGTRWGD